LKIVFQNTFEKSARCTSIATSWCIPTFYRHSLIDSDLIYHLPKWASFTSVQ